MNRFFKFLFFSACFIGFSLFSVDTGGTTASLDAAIASVNAGPDFTLNFNVPSLILTDQVRALNSDPGFTYVGATITVLGNNNTLFGSSVSRGFFIGGAGSSATGSVTIQDLNFSACRALGGDGAGAAAGGMGAGGGVFIGANTVVTLSGCTFSLCSVEGGRGSGASNGGGGGMRGDGSTGISGGGGFGGNGASGGGAAGGGCGGSSFGGDAAAGAPGGNFDGTTAPAGGPGIGGTSTVSAGFGGGGGTSVPNGANPNGGFGGGGGTNLSVPGIGGFGGGGGGGAAAIVGGAGGFGGGGGRTGSLGGFGGGRGTATSGGAGAGFGGALFMERGSQVTLEGSISFSGNTATAGSAGTVNTDPIAGFGALGQDIFMMSESTLIFDLSADFTMPTPIQGNQGFQTPDPDASTTTGGLIKRNANTLNLVGANTYTGTTTVEAGTLQINSSVVSDVQVNPGGTLSGSFDILNDAMGTGGNLTNGGIVSPGTNATIGTITLVGDYTQNASGNFMANITPGGQSDQLLLDGSASLAGTLTVVIQPGNYIDGTTYQIINAPTLGTEFETVLTAGINGVNPSSVLITVDYSSVTVTVANNIIFQSQFIQSGVPREVARCITDELITSGTDFADVVAILGVLTPSEVNAALFVLSPVQFGALEWINERNNNYVADLLSQHLFELCCSPRECDCSNSVWINVFGNLMDNRKRYDNLVPFDANAVGVLAGIDHSKSCSNAGVSIGYSYTDLDWQKGLGKGTLNSYYGAFYGSCTFNYFSINISGIGGASDYHLKRNIEFSTVDRTAKSSFWGYFFTAHLQLLKCWNVCSSTFEPYVLADYDYFKRDSFEEKGADSLNLDVKSKTQHFLRAEGGLKYYLDFICECSCFSPYLGLSWVSEIPLHTSRQKASFSGRDCVMNVKSYDKATQLISPQAGMKWTHCCGASFIIGYKGLYSKRVNINEVEGRFEWAF